MTLLRRVRATMIKHCVRRSHGSRTAVKRTENSEQEERQADECVDHAGACPGAIDDAGEAGRCGGQPRHGVVAAVDGRLVLEA